MIEFFFIRHQTLYRMFPTFILWGIRAKHLVTGHEGYIHSSHNPQIDGAYCTACRKDI